MEPAPNVDRFERHEAIGVPKRQRAQHHGVDDAEDGRVRADADGQRDEGGRGE